jgi:hypothetical protein
VGLTPGVIDAAAGVPRAFTSLRAPAAEAPTRPDPHRTDGF